MALGIWAAAFALLGLLSQLCRAEFTTTFKNVTRGEGLLLAWKMSDAKDFPLFVEGTAYDQTSGGEVNVFRSNLTSRRSVPTRSGTTA